MTVRASVGSLQLLEGHPDILAARITMKFDGMTREVNFLYKLEDGALRLEDTTGATFSGNQLKSRGVSPVIIYLKK